MTDSNDDVDFPLSMGALNFLCAPEAWNAGRAALIAWHVVAADIAPDIRCKVKAMYYAKKRLDLKPMAHFEVEVSDSHRTNVRLSPEQIDALEALLTAERVKFISLRERLSRGEVRAIACLRDKEPPAWHLVSLEQIGRYQISGKWAVFGGGKYDMKFRDTAGLPVEQAGFVYGSADLAKKMIDFENAGAPKHLGDIPYPFSGPLTRFDEYRTAPERYDEARRQLFSGLLGRLRNGDLIATENGTLVPLEVWRRVGSGEDQAMWRPGALVRSKVNGERNDGTVGPGRPSNRPTIMQWFEDGYVQPCGSLPKGKDHMTIARELMDRKDKEFPGTEPEKAETIAGWIGKYMKEHGSKHKMADKR